MTLSMLSIYSNVYFDFAAATLWNHVSSAGRGWPEAILYACTGDPVSYETDADTDNGMDSDTDGPTVFRQVPL